MISRARSTGVVACVLALAACGGAPTVAFPVAAVAAPVAPPPSFLHAEPITFVRVDCRALRETPIAATMSSFVRDVLLFGPASSFDAVASVDALAATSSRGVDAAGTPGPLRWRVLLHYDGQGQDARARFDSLVRRGDEGPTWHDAQGIPWTALPGWPSHELPHVLVLTASDEALVAPDDELDAVVAIARAQLAARLRDPRGAREPRLDGPAAEALRLERTASFSELLAGFHGTDLAMTLTLTDPRGARIETLATFENEQWATDGERALGLAHDVTVIASALGFRPDRPHERFERAHQGQLVRLASTGNWDAMTVLLTAAPGLLLAQ